MGKNLPVLVVDPDADHRTQLKQALSARAYAVIGEAGYGVEATRLASELRPDIIVMHMEQPLALAYRTLEVVQYAHPPATPIAISRSSDCATIRTAMLAGARGFLVSPAQDREIDAVIQKAYDHQQRLLHPQLVGEKPKVAGTVITVFGPKGGVGKTTLATNLAVGIRQRTEAKVALVDLDSYFGDVGVMMGIDPEHTFGDLLLAMRNGTGTAKDFLTRHRTGVDILAAPHSADAGPQPTVDEVVQILQNLAESYEFVVVDTPGAFGPLVATALDESALILMTTSADMASIKDTRLSLEILRGAGFDSDKLKLVVNHATNADSVSDQDLSRTVGYDIFWSIPHDREVPISTQHGIPVMVSNPRTKMALKVDALAAFVSGSTTALDGAPLNGYANGSSNGNGHHSGRSIFASLFSKGR